MAGDGQTDSRRSRGSLKDEFAWFIRRRGGGDVTEDTRKATLLFHLLVGHRMFPF